MRLIVARHCETDWNAANRIQGQADVPLNARGREQARQLAARLAGRSIALIVSSDLSRARETAEIVGAALGVPVRTDPRLRECSFGTLDGISFAEFALRGGPRNLSIRPDPLDADFTPFGGERGRDVHDRQRRALDDLAAAHPRDEVMIVGHGRSLRTLLVPLGHPFRHMKNGEFVVIEYP